MKKAFRTSADRWYRIVQRLGGGGSALTYLAMGTDGTVNGSLYAIKFFRRLDSESRRKRFLHEIRFLSTCDHPSIMRVVDSGSYTDSSERGHFIYPFLVAEYLPRTMSDVVRENQSSFVEKVSYIVQLLAAVSYLTDRRPSVIHRDIKPQNVFVKGRTCLLGDFGLMTVMDRDPNLDRGSISQSQRPAMPWYYRTPDLVAFEKDAVPITPASDVFQVALIAALLFTGKNPCRPAADLLKPVVTDPVGFIPGFGGAGVRQLITRMLEPNPQNRPTARAILDPWRDVFWEAADAAYKLNGKVM